MSDTVRLDSSTNPIGGRVNHGRMKVRLASPADMRPICLRSPTSRAFSKGSCVPAARTLLLTGPIAAEPEQRCKSSHCRNLCFTSAS
jgi:hypothetical protein